MGRTPIAPDLEALDAEAVLEHAVSELPPPAGARLLVPAGGVGDDRPAHGDRARARGSSRSTPAFCSRRPTRRGSAMEERYGIEIERPGISRRAACGDALWAREPDRCCAIRKVTPLEGDPRRRRRLDRRRAPRPGARARGHAEDRLGPASTASGRPPRSPTGASETCGATSTSNDLPYNPLHDRGYASIGCTHCTVAGADRSGRWAGSDKLECGLHG